MPSLDTTILPVTAPPTDNATEHALLSDKKLGHRTTSAAGLPASSMTRCKPKRPHANVVWASMPQMEPLRPARKAIRILRSRHHVIIPSRLAFKVAFRP